MALYRKISSLSPTSIGAFRDSILAIKEMAPIEQDKPAMAETLERLRKGRAITKERIRIITIASVHGWHVVGLYLQDKLVGDDKAIAAAVERAKRESPASSSSKNRSSQRDKSEPSSSSSSFYKKSSWKDRDTPWSYPKRSPCHLASLAAEGGISAISVAAAATGADTIPTGSPAADPGRAATMGRLHVHGIAPDRRTAVPHLLLPTSGRATDVRDLDTSPGSVQQQSKPLATPSLYKADG